MFVKLSASWKRQKTGKVLKSQINLKQGWQKLHVLKVFFLEITNEVNEKLENFRTIVIDKLKEFQEFDKRMLSGTEACNH